MGSQMKVVADVQAIAASKLSFNKEDSMRKMTTRQAISAIVALPIALIANTTEALANVSGPKIDPIKKVSDFNDRLDFDIPTTTTIGIEESEDWDEPEFSANLDMQITKFMTEGFTAEIYEPPPIVYLSAARGQSTRECRISGICE
jgi:hypothetical protein